MIAMRIPWYAMNDRTYVWREPFVNNLFVEYQKDIKVYLGILLVMGTYRLYRHSRGGGHPGRGAPAPDDRLVVQTGSGRAVLRFGQIDYLEAARNYVSVFAEGREYVVRDTMTGLAEALAQGPFARSHRSYIVNTDKVAEIRIVEGRHRVILQSGQDLPMSRGYREAFEAAMSGRAGAVWGQ